MGEIKRKSEPGNFLSLQEQTGNLSNARKWEKRKEPLTLGAAQRNSNPDALESCFCVSVFVKHHCSRGKFANAQQKHASSR